MKNKLHICLILIMSLFFLVQFSNKSNEKKLYASTEVQPPLLFPSNDETLYLTNNYATYYFNFLKENYGYNVKGSCGYIALQLLLSFYDTYWDDNLIIDDYEKNETISSLNLSYLNSSDDSPGTLPERTVFFRLDNYSHQQYHELILDEYTSYFHLYLLHIATTIFNYCDFSENTTYPCSSYIYMLENVLEYYLYNARNYTETEVEILKPSEGEDIESFIIENVLNGTPVIVLGGNNIEGEYGHFYVVYDYDSASDELLGHMGWNSQHGIIEHVRISNTNYTILQGAIALNFNSDHVCSNNYQYGDEEPSSYCPCYFGIHPSHEHVPTSFHNINRLFHYSRCHCGYQTTQSHVVTDSSVSFGAPRCILCNGEVELGFVTFGTSIIKNPLVTKSISNQDKNIVLPNGIIVIPDEDIYKYL